MSSTVRYPSARAGTRGPSEADQIIVIANADAGPLVPGGPATYADVSAWHIVGNSDEAPYTCISLEFTSPLGGQTIGLGTIPIYLFGVIGDLTAGEKFLLGPNPLGASLGNLFPQIPIVSAGVGFSQNISVVGVFDGLAVGTFGGNIELTFPVTIKARPIRVRNYVG